MGLGPQEIKSGSSNTEISITVSVLFLLGSIQLPKIQHARLIFADWISEKPDKQFTDKIKNMGFSEVGEGKEDNHKFTPSDLAKFKEPFSKEIGEGNMKISLIESVSIEFTKNSNLPLPVIIIEVTLDKGKLDTFIGKGLEGIVWKLATDLYRHFSKTHEVLNFSGNVFRNSDYYNSAIEIVVSMEPKIFGFLRNAIDEYSTFQSEHEQGKIGSALVKLIDNQPVKFYSNGLSNRQTIIKGYQKTAFVIGTVVQSPLDGSPPLYLVTFNSEDSTPRDYGNNPSLMTPRSFPLYDLSDGVGQLLFLDLLNSWNKYVEKELNKLVQHRSTDKKKLKDDISEKSSELGKLFNFGIINERTSVNFGPELNSIANPPEDKYGLNLKEIYVLDQFEAVQTIIGGYAQSNFHPVFSELAKTVLKVLKINESRVFSLQDLWKSRVEFLTNERSEKTNSKMYKLTAFIAFLTLINIIIISRPWIVSILTYFGRP